MRMSEKERVHSKMDKLQYEIAGLMAGRGKRPGSPGGSLALTTADGAPIIAGEIFGVVPRTAVDRLTVVALEQATRLALHPFHLTSHSSRKPRAEIFDFHGNLQPWGQRGGAIRTSQHILSYAGYEFSEKWNEAAMFTLAIKLGWINQETVFRRISAKRNPHLRPLLEACIWVEYKD
jgi:hypothetical protein